MLTLTDYAVAKLLDKGFGAVDFTAPVTHYLGLTSGGTELTIGTGGYARKAVTNNTTNFPGTSSRLSLMAVAQSFSAATMDWGTVDGLIVADASTAGNNWLSGPMADLPVLAFATASDDNFHAEGHGWSTGQAVRNEAAAGQTLPGNVTASVTRYVRVTDANNFTLYDTLAHALVGGATGLLDVSSNGVTWVMAWYGKIVSATDVFTVPANALKINLTNGS